MQMTLQVRVLLVTLAVRVSGHSVIINRFLTVLGATTQSLLTEDTPTPIEKDVTFWCCNSNTKAIQQTCMGDPQLQSRLNLTLPIIFVIHGYVESVGKIWMQAVLQDLCQYRLTNACGVDWHRLSNFIYPMAILHTHRVAQYVATFIEFLLTKGVTMDNIILVGFSLGAHVVGIIGSTLGGRVPLIIGLDPAGPFMTYPILKPIGERLDPTDAQSVQAIYTCIGYLGSEFPVGTQNFYLAGGDVPQPWCITNSLRIPTLKSIACSHLVAVEVFRRSLNKQNVIEGTMCDALQSFESGQCVNGQNDRLGLDSNRIPGKYYLNYDAPSLLDSYFTFRPLERT